eukprot:SAG31_NODE_276_length_18650_cov_5.821842_18_plen_91_part_00
MAAQDLKRISKQHQRARLEVDNMGREWVVDNKGNKRLKNYGVAANYVGGEDGKIKVKNELQAELSADEEGTFENAVKSSNTKKKKGCIIS